MKDNWTPTAIAIAFVAILASMLVEGSNPAVLIKPAPIILVFGGTFLAAMAGFMKTDLQSFSALIKVATKVPVFDGEASVRDFVSYASVVKREGVLELEKIAASLDDEFLALGFGLLASSKSSDELRELLDLPPSVRPMAVVPVGWPARPLGPPRRLPLRERAHRDRYGEPW